MYLGAFEKSNFNFNLSIFLGLIKIVDLHFAARFFPLNKVNSLQDATLHKFLLAFTQI